MLPLAVRIYDSSYFPSVVAMGEGMGGGTEGCAEGIGIQVAVGGMHVPVGQAVSVDGGVIVDGVVGAVGAIVIEPNGAEGLGLAVNDGSGVADPTGTAPCPPSVRGGQSGKNAFPTIFDACPLVMALLGK